MLASFTLDATNLKRSNLAQNIEWCNVVLTQLPSIASFCFLRRPNGKWSCTTVHSELYVTHISSVLFYSSCVWQFLLCLKRLESQAQFYSNEKRFVRQSVFAFASCKLSKAFALNFRESNVQKMKFKIIRELFSTSLQLKTTQMFLSWGWSKICLYES